MIITYTLATLFMSGGTAFFLTQPQSQNRTPRQNRTEPQETSNTQDTYTYCAAILPSHRTLSPEEHERNRLQAICNRENKRNEIDVIKTQLEKRSPKKNYATTLEQQYRK